MMWHDVKYKNILFVKNILPDGDMGSCKFQEKLILKS